ncbi:MAG: BatA and WFA domain-containing protein [Labilithrix sp.]|nr:BatA and WFA domain-containing protein [Labilithrix sp.]MCW5811945.1 BatA and WFA domain-containing protein [Labilithrix sp.]
MTFVAVLALGIGLFVVAPYLAHRLRRQRADEVPFAPVRLVPPTPPRARRRSRLEDRSLFALRAASIVALALLGASPLVRCSRLALSRGGASVAVAIVLDDSMSMRARTNGGASRFARAKKGAEEILAALRDGDAAAIVLAGAPARVGLAATTDISTLRAALDGMTESDRATDLDGAIAMARTLVGELPQIDRRVILLSDLADGKPDAPPLGESADKAVPVWVAMPELGKEAATDCGILSADRAGGRVRVRFACSTAEAAREREVRVMDGEKSIASAKLAETALGEVMIPVSGDDTRELVVELGGGDAIAADDRAVVVFESGPAALAVVGDRADDAVTTGGAPVVEQALAALHSDMAIRPIPQAPDRKEDTQAFAAIIVDDPPGFTPEQRKSLAAFVERGGVLVLALGRRAASAQLGATFEPFLARAVGFAESPSKGADPASASLLGEAASSLEDLGAKGRATLATEDLQSFEAVVRWTDGVPLIARKQRGRGDVWLSTLPFAVDASDLPLRPGFLALLDAVVADARERSVPLRGDVGAPWAFGGASRVEADGPSGRLVAARDDGALRLVPALIGPYRLTVDGTKELRVAAPAPREIDLRPRAVAPAATSSSLGGGVATVDVSWTIALVLLGLVLLELVVRAWTRAPGALA